MNAIQYWREGILVGAMLALFAGAMALGPIAQREAYHDFADKRELVGVRNFWNVASNAAFVIVGAVGLAWCASRYAQPQSAAWNALFLAVVLTGFGSAWYHRRPDNATLAWDRLPMTFGFMALFVALAAEHIDASIERWLLPPALAFGAASVLWWHRTQDLRPYLWAQFAPLLCIPLMLALFPARHTHRGLVFAGLGLYGLAKVAEAKDGTIFAMTGNRISGHTLKHFLAAAAILALFMMLVLREAIAQERHAPDSLQATAHHELSAGGLIRLLARDPGLIGGGNGGTGTSVNYDDGNLNYGRGTSMLGVQGRSTIEARRGAGEFKAQVVYFYDFLNAQGETDHRSLSAEARDRAGRNVYVNEAYVGYGARISDAALSLRLGNQLLRWSDSRYFGYSMAPVNPTAGSRRYQPANSPADASVALPMLFAKIQASENWRLEAFYLLAFKPSELEAAGTFLSGNDFYAPGGRYLQLGHGSPLVPDTDASVITPATPFGSRVPRAADRRPDANGQFGARIETAELGAHAVVVTGYAMRVHTREPLVSVNTGTLGGLLRITAPDYTSSGSYFVEHPRSVTVLGTSLRFAPARYTRVSLEYSIRLAQPLQIDDELLITAGLAPAAVVGACAANPGSALCAGTLAALNRNQLIAARGGITAADAARLFSTEIQGYERFDVSQYSLSLLQGLPPILAASQWSFAGDIGGLHIHGIKEGLVDALVSIRPDDAGGRRFGLATGSSWGYRLYSRLDYNDALAMRSVSPWLLWIHDVRGNAPITVPTFLQGNKSAILGVDFGVTKTIDARVSYRSFLNKGNDADRFSDRDFVSFSITRRF